MRTESAAARADAAGNSSEPVKKLAAGVGFAPARRSGWPSALGTAGSASGDGQMCLGAAIESSVCSLPLQCIKAAPMLVSAAQWLAPQIGAQKGWTSIARAARIAAPREQQVRNPRARLSLIK
jgi:hypothetical protein